MTQKIYHEEDKKTILMGHLPSVIIITFVTILVWHKLLNIVPSDFAYFGPLDFTDLRQLTFYSFTTNVSIFSQIIFFFLIKLFKDNLAYYALFQVGVMWLVYQTLYFAVVKITKDKLLSLLTAVFFAGNYVGSFTMLGTGITQRFIQRIPNLPFVFVAFCFLAQYLEHKKTKYLIPAFILYIISILLAHFSILFLPIFTVYPVVYSVLKKQQSLFFKSVLIALVFTLISVLLLRGDSFSRPNYSPLTFIKEKPEVVQMVLFQIPTVSFPQSLTIHLSKNLIPPISYPYRETQWAVLVLTAIVFTAGIIKGRKYPRILPLYISFLISLFLVSFMIIYAYDADPNPLKFFGEDRIYFFHSVLIAFVWAALVKLFFGRNKIVLPLAASLIGIMFLLQNTALIWQGMDKYQYRSNTYQAFINYIKTLSPSLEENSAIVAPPDLIRTTDPFIRRFYNLDKATFIAFENGWLEIISKTKIDRKNIFVLDYKYSYDSKQDIDAKSVRIVDKSEDFRLNKPVEPFIKP